MDGPQFVNSSVPNGYSNISSLSSSATQCPHLRISAMMAMPHAAAAARHASGIQGTTVEHEVQAHGAGRLVGDERGHSRHVLSIRLDGLAGLLVHERAQGEAARPDVYVKGYLLHAPIGQVAAPDNLIKPGLV